MSLGRFFAVIIISSALFSCGDDAPIDASVDAGGDAGDAGGDAGDTGPPPTCDASTVALLEEGDPDGHPDPLGAAPGEARAGVIAEADLPVDPEGLAMWEGGDYVLANDHVAMLIEQAGPSELYNPWGGGIVGVFTVEDGVLAQPADFNEVIFGVGRYTLQADSVTVLNDGSDGGPAIVRALGPLRPIPFIDELGAALSPGDYDDIELAIDYVLAPDADVVEHRFTFRSPRATPAPVRVPLVAVFQFSRMPAFTPSHGFAFDQTEPVDWVGFIDDDATSYAYRIDVPLEVLLDQAGTVLLSHTPYQIPPCDLTERPMGRFDIGGAGVDGLRVAMSRTDGITQRTITGTVSEDDGSPAAGVRVHAELADGTYYTRAMSGADGSFALNVPMEDVSLRAFRRGEPLVGPVPVPMGTDTAALTMNPVSTIEVEVRELSSGDPSPARIHVLSNPAVEPPPAEYGEAPIRSSRTHVANPADGRAAFSVVAGDHTVVVSRGYELEMVSADVTVAGGDTATVLAELERVVDTTDVMCGDFHIHTNRSPDSPDPARDKLLSAAGDGLEIPVRTDHEFVADFEPLIAELGLTDHLYGVSAIELTTFTYGHFNVFPLAPRPSERNGGSFFWPGKQPPELFGEIRTSPGAPAIIINHPRGLGLMAYFSAVGYDPVTGTVSQPDMWDEEFRLVEVFNDSDFDRNWDPSGESESTVLDWFSFLNAGRRVFAVGSSDSHKIHSSPVGYPRTCIELGTDEPSVLRAMGSEVVRDQLADGHATVSGGIYVDALARDGAGPGDDVMDAMDRETVSVRVQAANWIDADRLRVFVDGVLTETIVLDETTRDPMVPTTRFSQDLEIDVAPGGSWAVFVADGEDDLTPVHPGRRPFGVTNPIFFSR